MNNKPLLNGMMNVLTANIINLVFSLLTNFLLPKYLSIESYAGIKTFQLYCVYIGILHLGYVDGMFLKYGGKDLEDVNKQDLSDNLSTMRVFQLLVSIPALVVGVASKDIIIIFFACSILPLNMTQYFKFFYQSIGEFKRYGQVMNLVTGATFVINMLLLFVLRTDSLVLFLTLYLLVNIAVWVILELSIRKIVGTKTNWCRFSLEELKKSIKSGILLMIGNFTSTILSSMDRWFVKFLLELYDFAQYSFAVSVESVVNVAITPITVTLYNYFCKHKDDYQLEKDCKAYVTVFSTLVVAAAFPAKFIIEVFLTEYTKSVGVIFYLFAAQIIYIVVKSVYVNLYKAKHKQRKYFTKLCVVIASGFLFNCICYLLLKSKESFAIGTLLSAIVWLILSELDFRELRYSCIEYLYILAEILLFVFCGTKLSSVFGMLVYLFVTGVLDMVVFRATIVKLVQLIRLRFQEGIK